MTAMMEPVAYVMTRIRNDGLSHVRSLVELNEHVDVGTYLIDAEARYPAELRCPLHRGDMDLGCEYCADLSDRLAATVDSELRKGTTP